MKVFTMVALMAALAVAASAKATHHHQKHSKVPTNLERAQGDELDPALCKGKQDENVYHPSDCTKFVSCTNERSIEMDCGDCNSDIPDSCLRGKLVFSLDHGEPLRGQCVHAYESTCKEDSEPTTETPTEPPVTQDPERPPQPGDECDPDHCETIGYCQHYLRCDKESKVWVREECGQDLVWNPKGDGEIHGGNCDFWENLDEETEAKYRSDPDCLACFWKETGECQREYLYQAPGLSHRNVETLSCADGLVFSLAKETCQRCEDVDRADGSSCC